MPAYFSTEAVRFLDGLARHNERDWFGARRHIFERSVKAPMLELIEELNGHLAVFAPEHVRPAAKCLMRIYRDTRFSADKSPYKTQISAWWARDGLGKTGAGFYLSLRPAGVVVAAGAYMPDRPQLLAIRQYLAGHAAEFRELVAAATGGGLLGELEGGRLNRPPKGFAGLPAEALELLRHRQWGLSAELPPDLALSARLAGEVATRFRLAAPVVALLNRPLVSTAGRPLF